jgi:hypothetical protein
MEYSKDQASTGLVFGGIIASETPDTSGEVLVVKGCDISSLVEFGVLNFEHKGPDNGGSFESIVGKILWVKKIYSESECSNKREREYFDSAGGVPIIMGHFRLFDGQDHPSAKAAAAIMRDQEKAGEKQILRLSIEGATLEREGNMLKQTIARAVALTARPANQTCRTDILRDPKSNNGPDDALDEILEETSKNEDGINSKLSSVPYRYIPFDSPEEKLSLALQKFQKAMGADIAGGVPGSETQGAALATSEQKSRAKAALRDYDKFSHGPFRPYIKAQLPDASDEFLDHFTDLVDDLSSPKKDSLLKKVEPSGTPKASSFHISRREVSVDPKYQESLEHPSVRALHDKAMGNWFALHGLIRSGQVPREIVAHNVLSAAMDPSGRAALHTKANALLQQNKNTTSGYDSSGEEKYGQEFKAISHGNMLPQYASNHFGPKKISTVKGSIGDYRLFHGLVEDLVRHNGADSGLDDTSQSVDPNHPAAQWTREEIIKRHGDDVGEHARIPGTWLHWLASSPQEIHRSQMAPEGIDRAVYMNAVKSALRRYGIPDQLLKSQGDDVWGDGGSMPARTAHATKELRDQFGETPSQVAYYAFMVPALLGGSNHPIVKIQNLTKSLELLVKANPPQEPKPTMFRDNVVIPGEIEHLVGTKKGWRNPLLHRGKGWHIIQGDEGENEKLLPQNEGKTYRILRNPVHKTHGLMVHVAPHALKGLSETPEQKDLVEGLDLTAPSKDLPGQEIGYTNREGGVARWAKSASGKPGWVKSSDVMKQLFGSGDTLDDFSTAQREAAVYGLAKNVFGLGQYVPVTAAFQHPITGEHHSVQERVEGGEHWNQKDPALKDHLHQLLHNGTLDKLALMDMVVNNSDRHPGNYLLTPGKGGGISLIDNGLTFAPTDKHPQTYVPSYPHYWDRANRNAFVAPGDKQASWGKQPLHPEAVRWVNGLDINVLAQEMQRIGIPQRYRDESVRRLNLLKKEVAKPNVTKQNAYFAPFVGHGISRSAFHQGAPGVDRDSVNAELGSGGGPKSGAK